MIEIKIIQKLIRNFKSEVEGFTKEIPKSSPKS